jgi:RNA polymerase sigma-54 factor
MYDQLCTQLQDSDFNVVEREIAQRLLGELDERGYFTGSLEKISAELSFPESWLNSVRKRLLFFDPVGCFSVTLEECVWAQIQDRKLTPNKLLESVLSSGILMKCISNPRQMAKSLNCTHHELQKTLNTLSGFKRHPTLGDDLAPFEATQTQLPQVEIVNVGESLQVNGIRSDRQQVFVNKRIVEKIARSKDERADFFIKQKVKRASWFVGVLERRERTIVRVAKSIAEHQKSWFQCSTPLLPLTMKKVAHELELHESTVSRAVADKFLRCERGTFEIRSFFVSQIKAENDSCLSSDAVKQAIRKLIEFENPQYPLSDQAICERLNRGEIRVARRTIAKYREQLKIVAASHRKQP